VTYLYVADWALTLALLPPFGFLALVTAAALRPWPRRPPASSDARPRARFLVVIPAHDEQAHIAATVASCRALDYDPSAFRVWVIADNCTDATAEAARGAGASVLERRDPDRRSKGHALEYFFGRTAAAPDGADFDAAVIIDADTVVDPRLLDHFAAALAGGDDWLQGYYTVRNPDASWRTRLLTYAFSLFNGVWLLGQDRLGLGVGFRGNGMCFSRAGLGRVPWRAYGLVEDQEFSWVLRVAGERVRFLPSARVYGEMVSRGPAAVSQRRRWEDGRRSLRSRFRRPLLAARTMGPIHKLLALVDLNFPPLTTLAALLALAWAVDVFTLASERPGPQALALLAAHGLMASAVAAYAVAPFLTLGLPWRYLLSLSALPLYMAWKVAAKFRARATTWVRTEREPTADPPPL